jgi:hypothetical protein
MQYLQFYQDMNTGTVAALEMNEDGSPKEFQKPDLHKGRICYGTYEVSWKMGFDIRQWYGPNLPDPKEYRRISKQEAKEIDDNTEYSMYQIFASACGLSQTGEFFNYLGEEGVDWKEIPHAHLKPSLAYHRDIAAIQSTFDFWHPKHAAKQFGIETINKVIRMQRKNSARYIVEQDNLFAEAPKDSEGNILVMIQHGDLEQREICSYCGKGIRRIVKEE